MKQNLAEKTVMSLLVTRLRMSIPEIAQQLGIANSTIVGILGRLKKKGLATAGEAVPYGRGRPVVTYHLRLPCPVAAFVFDGTRLSGALFDEELRTKALNQVDFVEVAAFDQAISLIAGQLDKLLTETGVEKAKLAGISISANAVRLGRETLLSSVLPWANELLQGRLAEVTGTSVKVVNFPILLAEYQKISEFSVSSMVMFNVGDGISAHMAIANQIYEGASCLAGELGHLIVIPGGALCGCGRKGCLEAYCSGPAIYKQVISDLDSAVASGLELESVRKLSPRKAIELIWQSWCDKDTYTRALMDEVIDKLAWGLGMVLNLVDPEMVIFGGYLLENKSGWIDEIKRRSERWTVHMKQRKIQYECCHATMEDQLRAVGSNFYYD
ncbi:MAG: ROK family protein [Planctomycetota bacterium]